MRISDWSSDVCSSDLPVHAALPDLLAVFCRRGDGPRGGVDARRHPLEGGDQQAGSKDRRRAAAGIGEDPRAADAPALAERPLDEMRSEEHTSELQSLMRISYAVFCLKKKKYRD